VKRARREEKKLSPEDDIDAILVTNYNNLMLLLSTFSNQFKT
jgi:hypothetical protein